MIPPGDVLIGQREIASRIVDLARDLAGELRRDLAEEGASLDTPGRVVMIPVLSGSIIFFADLVRRLPVALATELVSVSSYRGATTESLGASLEGALPGNLAGKHVVIVDDILDSGRTLGLLRGRIGELGPASLRICVLLRKERPRDVPVEADLVGFDIPDVFVVGYGLDYDGHYRNLPDVRLLEGAGG
ncbi:MAG: hypoxanthine phosphoribosyltransferase [Planctomycetota bacterium]|nr:MAG: hypoxanthine phosphoribosyltransferase [Planctomycetota bacterium]